MTKKFIFGALALSTLGMPALAEVPAENFIRMQSRGVGYLSGSSQSRFQVPNHPSLRREARLPSQQVSLNPVMIQLDGKFYFDLRTRGQTPFGGNSQYGNGQFHFEPLIGRNSGEKNSQGTHVYSVVGAGPLLSFRQNRYQQSVVAGANVGAGAIALKMKPDGDLKRLTRVDVSVGGGPGSLAHRVENTAGRMVILRTVEGPTLRIRQALSHEQSVSKSPKRSVTAVGQIVAAQNFVRAHKAPTPGSEYDENAELYEVDLRLGVRSGRWTVLGTYSKVASNIGKLGSKESASQVGVQVIYAIDAESKKSRGEAYVQPAL